ncbi:hypothetical protein BS78_06G071100 [Paspalum vaginatum]|nr:hypothetical protein BS78_06G071100 [Paspalum vaginatum]
MPPSCTGSPHLDGSLRCLPLPPPRQAAPPAASASSAARAASPRLLGRLLRQSLRQLGSSRGRPPPPQQPAPPFFAASMAARARCLRRLLSRPRRRVPPLAWHPARLDPVPRSRLLSRPPKLREEKPPPVAAALAQHRH